MVRVGSSYGLILDSSERMRSFGGVRFVTMDASEEWMMVWHPIVSISFTETSDDARSTAEEFWCHLNQQL